MRQHQTNIVIVSNDQERIQNFRRLLKDPKSKITVTLFREALQQALVEEPLDFVLFDCFSEPQFDYRILDPFRKHQSLKHVPFLFVLDTGQDTLKRQIYKNPQNRILVEPVDKFSLISIITASLHLTRLERKLFLYQDFVDGEKKLINNIDKLLELNRLYQYQDENILFNFIQTELVKRLELSLAVETAFFALYNKKENVFSVSLFSEKDKRVLRKHTFHLSQSNVSVFLKENIPHIFEKNELGDPLIQELEESFGFKIYGILFVPLSVFHQPRGGVILINKIYRNEFSENDLAFTLIACQKINFHLENIHLQNLDPKDDSKLKFLSGNESNILAEWRLYRQIMESVNFINKAAREILNLTSETEDKKNLADFFARDEFLQLKNNIETRKLPLVRQEIQLRLHNIPDFYLGYSIYQFETTGEGEKFILIFSEISQTKRIQAEIIRMDRMASLGVLSSGIAHEIRNPLAGIKAMAQSLEDELAGDALKVEYIERILRQVKRLDELLRAFFSYAKPVRPDPSAIHIKKVVKEVLPLFERKMRDENIIIQQSYAKDLHKVFVDANQIEQVFLNLFLNAFDAMSGQGRITITAVNAKQSQHFIDRRNRVPGLFSNKFIEISIRDDGVGIDEENIDQVFNPFFTTKANGTGLGLSIVYQILKEHGGQIDVKSTVGEGSEFIILLPAFVGMNAPDMV